MEANVQKKSITTIPAGLISGKEAFTVGREKYLQLEGRNFKFDEAPREYRQLFWNKFLSDKESQRYLRTRFGIYAIEQQFDKWFHCKFGGLDHIPDIDKDEELVPDAFNNTCEEKDCPHRGRFCGKDIPLKSYDLKVLGSIARGNTIQQTANELCMSEPGVKSRLDANKIRVGARNTVECISKLTQWGVIF